MKIKSIFSNLTAYLFLVVVFFFFLSNIVVKDKAFSEEENRYLQTAPKLSVKRLASGDFMSEYERFLSDQFLFRNDWIALKARCELLLGKEQNNGVFISKSSSMLLNPVLEYKKELLIENTENVKSFAEKNHDKTYFALIPNKEAVYPELLPKNLEYADTCSLIDSVYLKSGAKNIDIQRALKDKKSEYIFYRTDHHWTSLGAYYGSCALADPLGYDIKPVDSYADRMTVSENFKGTNVSGSAFYWFAPDSIDIFVPENKDISVINYSAGKAEKGRIYVPEYLEKKDKYKFFFGGNTPLIELENKSAQKRSILIIRDSFCDSLLPFLLNEYSDISVVDLRYFNESLSGYIKHHNFDRILIIYGIRTFIEDNNLYKLNK